MNTARITTVKSGRVPVCNSGKVVKINQKGLPNFIKFVPITSQSEFNLLQFKMKHSLPDPSDMGWWFWAPSLIVFGIGPVG